MHAIGIICELNPFHEGHACLIAQLRRAHPEPIALVACMSGPFVQRGTPAILDKWTRAKIAIAQGFDLVVELPQAYVLQAADYFAWGGVRVLSLLPDVRSLAFGVEEVLASTDFQALLRKKKEGSTQMQIRQSIAAGSAYRQALSQALDLPLAPNAILALAYAQAVEDQGLSWTLEAYPRAGAADEDPDTKKACPSASALRRLLCQDPAAKNRLPSAHRIQQGHFTESLQPLLAYYRLCEILAPVDFSASPAFESGMDFRLQKALRTASSIEEAFQSAANKRQSQARYRRLFVSSLLGLSRAMTQEPVAYLRPLAFTPLGQQLLSRASCPVVQKPTRRLLVPAQEAYFQLDARAQALQEALCGLEKGLDYRQSYLHREDH